VGLVYTPVEPVSIYGTYVKGYQPQSAGTIGAPETFGGTFDPLISNMVEGGVKMDMLDKKLFVTTSVYRIEQNNILINASAAENPDLLRQIGQQQSKGFEVEAYGKVLPNFSVTGAFAYNIAKITESDNPAEIGTAMPGAPKVQGNLWMRYNIVGGPVDGFGIGLGTNYVSERNTNNTALQLPSYWVANAALYYTVDKFKLQANFNNVFNKTYWVGGFDFNRLFPGAPRNTLVSIGYTF
jgi:iron complex outermembrane receptor protein